MAGLIAGAASERIAVIAEPLMAVIPIAAEGFASPETVPVVRQLEHEIAPAALTVIGELPVKAPAVVVTHVPQVTMLEVLESGELKVSAACFPLKVPQSADERYPSCEDEAFFTCIEVPDALTTELLPPEMVSTSLVLSDKFVDGTEVALPANKA